MNAIRFRRLNPYNQQTDEERKRFREDRYAQPGNKAYTRTFSDCAIGLLLPPRVSYLVYSQ
jgi:hypothetical protein